MPGKLSDRILKAFIEREKLEWERERDHLKLEPAAAQERKLEIKRAELVAICERKIQDEAMTQLTPHFKLEEFQKDDPIPEECTPIFTEYA